ncbi:hypothetical protein ACFQZX_11990 [Mucilaginibacter litoreus]|uniref:Bacteriocin-type signal sequence-containing protein n=1 Tax=Mucilaginibacter litoreus TaxID=1048221 RepID=A0ABW3AU13_9SPHI
MKNFKDYQKKRLTREEARNVLGGVRNPDDDCPAGTHEYICVTTAPGGQSGLDDLIYLRYCVQDGQPNPPCSGPI